jgi:hypothetical protein
MTPIFGISNHVFQLDWKGGCTSFMKAPLMSFLFERLRAFSNPACSRSCAKTKADVGSRSSNESMVSPRSK